MTKRLLYLAVSLMDLLLVLALKVTNRFRVVFPGAVSVNC